MAAQEIERLIDLVARLPGLGPRSARRLVLHLIQRRSSLMEPLALAIQEVSKKITSCEKCGNLDIANICSLCRDPTRDGNLICVVETVADLWALERSSGFKGLYHVLGGVFSALDGIGPDELNVSALVERVETHQINEVVLALNATVEGQATAHYLSERLTKTAVSVSVLSRGIPIGGELDYLDDGTLSMALTSRRPIEL